MAAALRIPPGPPGSVGKHVLHLYRDPIGFLLHLSTYGDVAHFRVGPQRVYLLNDPDAIGEVLLTQNKNFTKGYALQQAKRLLGEGLLTSEGDFHKRQRRLIQPIFHRERIQAYAQVMVDHAQRTGARWKPGQTVDMAEEMMRLSLSVVGKTLFDADVEHEAQDVGEALIAGMDMINRFWQPWYRFLEPLPTPHNLRFKRARARLDGIVFGMIEERRRNPEAHRGDLLTMLVEAQDAEGTGSMTNEQVRDEAMTIFLAGHETTALAMTWTWYLLSQHPVAMAKLRAELADVLGGRAPGLADVPKLAYTRMVFAEGMRMYPPAWVLGRKAIGDCVVGGYDMPAGSLVLLSQYVTHHHPKYFPDPWTFDPQRWAPETAAARPRLSYFPFGAGPRVCVGEQFAWMEGVLVLATLAQQWDPRLVPGHVVEPLPHLTLRPKHGMKMVLRPAADGPHPKL